MNAQQTDVGFLTDAPIVATLPHFVDAHEAYGHLVEGLNPDPDKHRIFMEIEPYTGSPLRGGAKVQFNMFLKRIEAISKLRGSFESSRKAHNFSYFLAALSKNFNVSRLFPILWIDEGIALNDQMTSLIKGDLTNILNLITILQWTFVCIGIGMIVGMTVWWFIARKNKVSKTTSVDPIITVSVKE